MCFDVKELNPPLLALRTEGAFRQFMGCLYRLEKASILILP